MRRRRPIVPALVGAVFALVANMATNTVEVHQPWWPSVVWTAVALLIVALLVLELRHRSGFTDAPGGGPLEPDVAVRRLAAAVDAHWKREERRQRVHDPVPLPVRWRAAPGHLLDHWANIRKAPAGAKSKPLRLAGGVEKVVEVYRRVPSGRLVVLGEAGSGKTVLAIRFALDWLDARSDRDPVAVIFRLGSWAAGATSLRDWLVEQLIHDHPGLAAVQPGGGTTATALVDGGRVLPVLDGFDEIAEGLRDTALKAMNATSLPLVLTSRTAEYTAAAERGVLSAAAGVELVGLAPADVADYLFRTARRLPAGDPDKTRTAWDPVLARLRGKRDDPAVVVLAAVLSSPLMVALARTAYSDVPGRDPVELLDGDRFPAPQAVEDHLLTAFVPAAYRHPPPEQPSVGSSPRPVSPEQAQRWLGHLARLDAPEIAWWRLADLVPGPVRALAGAASSWLLVMAAGGFAAVLWWDAPIALLVSLAVAALCGLVFATGGHQPERRRLDVRAFLKTVLGDLGVWVAVGLALDLALDRLSATGPGFSGNGLAITVAGWLLTGGLPRILNQTSYDVLDVRTVTSPAELLSTDRRNTFTKMPLFGAVLGLASGIASWMMPGASLSAGLAVLMVLAPSFAGAALGLLVGIGTSSWGRWLVLTRGWQPLAGRLPRNLLGFLDDACRRGVLKQSGAVYEFRHARLRHHLATPPSPGAPSPGSPLDSTAASRPARPGARR
ncbi:hypothetical protein GCM10009660_00710 [Catellatospora bangladeshensis]